MVARVKIDLQAGLLEVEGTEAFVREIYAEFWANRTEANVSATTRTPARDKTAPRKKAGEPESKKPTRQKASKRNRNAGLEVVRDLDLSGKGGKESLRDLIARLGPKTNFERNLVFVHYLSEVCGVEAVSENHVYTCYHTTPGVTIPANLKQSLWDTSHHRAWLDTASLEAITVTTHGINYLEHDMGQAGE